METYAPLKSSSGLPDVRLKKRLARMLDQFTAQPNAPIPQATENRNDMDAAYNYFDNPQVNPSNTLVSCLPETLDRLAGLTRVLVIQDTTDSNFTSLTNTVGLGYTDDSHGRGLLVHTSLAVSPEGLPIGLLSQQIWTRDPALKGQAKKLRKTATEKESYRWIDHAAAARAVLPANIKILHVADREGDVYAWFAAPRPSNADLLVRVAQAQRMVVHGPDGNKGKLSEVVRAQNPLGHYELEVPRADDRPSRQATLTLRMASMKILPPKKTPKRLKMLPVSVWVIEAFEEHPPAGVKALCWRLVTTEPLSTLEDVLRALKEYVIRWRIERFHYVLKQGCQVEKLQLEKADRLSNAIAVYSQVAVRVLRLTYLSRVAPETPAKSSQPTRSRC
jgi:hypothetical protein